MSTTATITLERRYSNAINVQVQETINKLQDKSFASFSGPLESSAKPAKLIEHLANSLKTDAAVSPVISDLESKLLAVSEQIVNTTNVVDHIELNQYITELLGDSKLGQAPTLKELQQIVIKMQHLLSKGEVDSDQQISIIDQLEGLIAINSASISDLSPASGATSGSGSASSGGANDFSRSVLLITLTMAVELMNMNFQAAKVISMGSKVFDKVLDDLAGLQALVALLAKFYKELTAKRQEANKDTKNYVDRGYVDWKDADNKNYIPSGYTTTGQGNSFTLYFSSDEVPEIVREYCNISTSTDPKYAGKYIINKDALLDILKVVSNEVAGVLPGKEAPNGELFQDWQDGMFNSYVNDKLNEQIANKIKTCNDKLSTISQEEGLFQNGAERGQRFFETVSNMIQQLVVR